MRLPVILLPLMFCPICHAAEIVAWKVPLSRFAEKGLDTGSYTKLGKVPEPSVFFKEGDECWDFSNLPTEAKSSTGHPPEEQLMTTPPLEWAVWNASTGYLVTKSEWTSIWQLQQLLQIDEQPKQYRSTLDLIEVPPDGGPLSPGAVAVASLTWTGKQGAVTASNATASGFIRAESKITIQEDNLGASVGIDIDCAAEGHARMKFRSEFHAFPGEELWIARDFDGRKGLDLRFTCKIEQSGGTPIQEVVMIQEGGSAESLITTEMARRKRRVGDAWLSSIWMSPQQLIDFDVNEEDTLPDPFAITTDKPSKKRPLRSFPVRSIPEAIRPWVRDPVWNIEEYAGSLMTGPGEKDVIGYDLLSQRAFIYSPDEKRVTEFEALHSSMCCLEPPPRIVFHLGGSTSTRLLAQSGAPVHLDRLDATEKTIRSIALEPTLGDTGDLLDTPLVYQNGTGQPNQQDLNGLFTLKVGIPMEILSASAKGQTTEVLRATAETLPGPP